MVTRGLLLFALLPALHAQPGSVIRVESHEVLLDVTVTGRKGAATGNLAAEDFAVWEDGKPQKITGVSSVADDPESAPKHFVLFFDWSTMALPDEVVSLRAATAFVQGMASPDRHLAAGGLDAMGAHVYQNFTTSAALLTKALKAPIAATPQASGMTAGGVSDPSSRVATAGVGRLPLPSRNVAVWTPASPDIGQRFLDAMQAMAQSLAPGAGRKTLLLFTGGWPADSPKLKDAIVAFNRADVAVHVILGNPRSANTPSAADFARMFADRTGGEVLRINDDLPEELARVARQQDEAYRLAYVPPSPEPGTCHSLRVKVNVKGAAVRSRNEYCAVKPVDLVAGQIAGETLESRAGRGNLTASMQVPYFYTGANRASVRLALEVVPAGMQFRKDKNKRRGQIDLVGAAVRSDGAIAARFADSVAIDKDQRQADAFVREPYRYENQFVVPSGKYTFRVTIGAGPEATGQIEAPLEVDPWNAAQLGIGGIALSNEAHPASESVVPVLEGRGPLVAGPLRFVPSATGRFRRTEHAWFYTEIYDPLLAGENPPAVQVRIRILDRKTGEVKVDTGKAGAANFVRAGNPVVPFATALPLASLPAGSFRLEVTAGDSATPSTVARTIDFEVLD